MEHDLDGREYKLLLDPDSLGESEDTIEAVFQNRLRALLGQGKGRKFSGRFGAPKRRSLRFFDTQDHLLDNVGYCLRRRSEGGDAEITLKLRLPDFFVVAGTALGGQHRKARTKFEEDISPLEATGPDGEMTIAVPPSIRSRFALSTSQALKGDPVTFGDAFNIYPSLRDNLGDAGIDPDPSLRFLPGPMVSELVFTGPRIDFGGGIRAKAAITLWSLSSPARVSRVAEISFRYDTIKGQVPGDAARAAFDLFADLQFGLEVESQYPSKTRLALP